MTEESLINVTGFSYYQSLVLQSYVLSVINILPFLQYLNHAFLTLVSSAMTSGTMK